MSKKIDAFTELATQPANADLFLLELASSGAYRKIKWQNVVADGSITTAKLATTSVTSPKIDFGGAGVGVWWEEIARTTLGTAGDTITVSSIPARKYLKVIYSFLATGGTLVSSMRYNSDSGANYSIRYQINSSFSTGVSAVNIGNLSGGAEDVFGEIDIINIANKIKLGHALTMYGDTNAATAPDVVDFWTKWVNTSNQISTITMSNAGTGDFAIGSEVVVLGHN